MEFEKNFFIIHQRLLSFRWCKVICFLLFSLFLLAFIFFAGIWVYSDIAYKANPEYIAPLHDQLRSMYNGTIPESLIMNFIIADVPENNISNETYTGDYYEFLACSGETSVLRMKEKIRNQHGFRNVTILINPATFTNSTFVDFALKNIIGYSPVLINQIIYGFDDLRELSIIDQSNNNHYMFRKQHLDMIDYLKNPGPAIGMRIVGIIRIIFGLFLASNIASLYFLITIIGIPIFILVLIEVFLRFYDHPQLNAFRFLLYKTFPWLGLYLHTINLNEKSQVRWIFFSQVGIMIVFYCIYVSLFQFLDSLLFIWSFPLDIDIKFYILIMILEVCSFLFMRTRTSLKFFPKFVFIFLFIFCFYIQFNGYAFYDVAFYSINFAAVAFLFLFITFFEIPSMSWNPSYHYTPSAEKPRTLYNPLFSMAWYYDLPQLWTMFYPLHDRTTFTENEMALVDRKYVVLNQMLNNQQFALDPEGARSSQYHNNNQHPEENNREPNLFNRSRSGINNSDVNSLINNRPEVRNRSNENEEIREQLIGFGKNSNQN